MSTKPNDPKLSIQTQPQDPKFVNNHLPQVNEPDSGVSSPGMNTSSVVFNDASIRGDGDSVLSVGGIAAGRKVATTTSEGMTPHQIHALEDSHAFDDDDDVLSPELFREQQAVNNNGASNVPDSEASQNLVSTTTTTAGPQSERSANHGSKIASVNSTDPEQAQPSQNAQSNAPAPQNTQQPQDELNFNPQPQQKEDNPSESSHQQQDVLQGPPPFLRYLCFSSTSTFNSLTKHIFGFSKLEQMIQEIPIPNAPTPTNGEEPARAKVPVCILSEKRESLNIFNCQLQPIQKEQDKLMNLSILNQGIKHTLQRGLAEGAPHFQLQILRHRLEFTKRVATSLGMKNKKNQLNSFKKIKAEVDNQVNQYLQLSEKTGGVDKKVNESLFAITLKHRQIVDQLMLEQKKKKLLTPTLPVWKKQFKFFFDNGNVVVRQNDTAMFYVWEYVNPSRPLIQTKNMDAIFEVIMQAWSSYRLLAMRGDMGASSVFQTFAQSVGYHPVVKDCTKFTSWDEVEKILAGALSSSGCLILQNMDQLTYIPSAIHANAFVHLCRVMDEVHQTLMNRSAQVEIGRFQFQMTGPFLVMGTLPTTSDIKEAPYPDCQTAIYEMQPFALEEILEAALMQKGVPSAQVVSFASSLQQFMLQACQSYSPMPHYDLGLRETLSVVEALEVANTKKVNHAFHTALTRVHLPKLCKADVPKFQQAIKWLKKCPAPKQSNKETAFAKALQSSSTPLSAPLKLKLHQLYHLLEQKPTMLVCKDADQVSALTQAFLEAYSKTYPDTKVMLHNTTRATKKSYIIGKRSTPHPLAEMLKETYVAHKNNAAHNSIVAFQGYLKSAWFSALQGVFDFQAISFANGERIAIAPTVRFLFSTSSEELQESLPMYYFGKCAIVYVD